MEHDPTLFAARLRDMMRVRAVSQADLGDELGLPQSAVSDRLRCRTPWRFDEVLTVADLLDVSLDELAGTGRR
jgi:predicted transcriptional regulator